MPTTNGVAATRIIKQELPSTRIVMVSQHYTPGFVREALLAGAVGYVVKSDAPRDLIPELRRICGSE